MGTMVENIREICREKGIAVSRLESDLGYGNGYLNPKKIKAITTTRAAEIAEYLGVPLDALMGMETKKSPATEGEGWDDFTYAAHGYSGQLTEADKATIVKMMETLAAANEEDNGQADGGLQRSE